MAENDKSKSTRPNGSPASKPGSSRPGAKLSKAERRDAARREAERLRAAQAKREKRNRWILFSALGVVAVLIAVAAVVIIQQANRTLLSDFEGATPAGSDLHGGIPVGAEGAGTPNEDAPVVQVYLDFMCPYCGQFEDANAADLDALREAGEITVTYHPVSNLDRLSMDTQYSTRTANAAATVADAAPEAFVPFMNGLFAQQPAENTEGLTDEQIGQIALDAGVPQDVVDTFADGTFNEWVGLASQQAGRDGATGTPTVFVDGEKLPGDVDIYTPGVLAAWFATEEGIGPVDPAATPSDEPSEETTPEPTETASVAD
ncbi:DSBA oxidoreductase [Beutenbergia cavernae DSM 12333]|uniref:DSBA oxidoreductase n=1 Tax=Beutenbergia cavernae (strain ATCC BAA-8 / DSM 12333 / CCUG 43141 / JCM 11478 / NBRC 16432 / NCIMB 13614 / HKI 0122) TaxID=471853 RepID=C5BYV2_BEUC1|nr:thioredoxin domain-containing protein [Beutenbergia cavernae]ACQ79060.1 DSBA oxidoreductase [Beutenbergia cavernae DSM 12333]